MGVYAVDSNIARAIVKRRGLLIVLLAALLPGMNAAMDLARGARDKLAVDLQIALFFPAFAAVAVFLGYRNSLERLTSFRLTVSPDEISWEKPDVLKHVVPRKSVRRILVRSSGEVIVVGARRVDTIRIPSSIGAKDALLAELSAWRPLEKARLSQWQVYVLRVLAAIAGLTGIAFVHGRPVAWVLLALLCGMDTVVHWSRQQQLSERLLPLSVVPVLALNLFFQSQDTTRAAHRADLRRQVDACQARMQVIVDRTTEEIWQLNELRRSVQESGLELKDRKPSKAVRRKLLETHEANLRKYASLEAALKSDLVEYQAVVDQHNALVTEYNTAPKR